MRRRRSTAAPFQVFGDWRPGAGLRRTPAAKKCAGSRAMWRRRHGGSQRTLVGVVLEQVRRPDVAGQDIRSAAWTMRAAVRWRRP